MISGPIGPATPGITGGGNVRTLVLRVWVEPGASPGLRARIVEIAAGRGERPVLVATSVDEACQAVRKWLRALEADGLNDDGDGTVTGKR
jgi:predicted RNase H-like nuclease (RuvC/YqgF family)